MPATTHAAPAICAGPSRSPNNGTETSSTVTMSMCEAAKAGPTGAYSSNVIQVMNAPM